MICPIHDKEYSACAHLDHTATKVVKEDRADKHDGEKVPVELVPASFIESISRVLAHGARKYARNNWTKGLPWTRILGSTLRHVYAWARKEDLDPESGLPHLAHAATNIMFLMTWAKTKPELDDRFDYEKKDDTN